MSHKNTFFITTPIYYVNDVPHIGHAYTTVAADVLARYHRLLLGVDNVFFLTGVDEHGQKVQQAAAKAGVEPQAYCDKLAPQFERLWTRLNISHNAFIRTTETEHKAIVQRYLQQLLDKELIYSDQYTGWYCTFDERFWTDKDVVDGLCPDCNRLVEKLSERNYFFRMGQYQDQLIAHIKAHPDFVRPDSRRNEVLGFLTTQKLGDLSISRPKSRLSWGIELPFDRDYVTYVWFDALVNYLSALEYKQRPELSVDRFWPPDVHLVGKDILTTHAVYWSTILMALNLPLPETIFAHGWWTVNGEKMSKSRGNVVDPHTMADIISKSNDKVVDPNSIDDEIKQVGTDAFRYFLLREVPFGHDGDFSREALIGRINSDLANGLGNLFSRTITLIEQNTEGRIPAPSEQATTAMEHELQQACIDLVKTQIPETISRLEFSRTLGAIWRVVQLANQYVDKTAPWTLNKKPEDAPRLHAVLYHMAETLRLLSLALFPFMPYTAKGMNILLGGFGISGSKLSSIEWNWGGLPPGTEIRKGSHLFPRIEAKPQGAKTVSDTTTSPQPSIAIPTPTPATPQTAAPIPTRPVQITIDEFMKIQLKTAKVLSAERVPKSDKLLKLQVTVGTEQRQIVAGIGKKYEPEALIGKTIVIVANLKPAKLMGIESQGMVLAAGDSEVRGLITLLEDVEPGTKVK